MVIIPQKLKKGDEIRVIAPSRSLSLLSKDIVKAAKEKLENEGFRVRMSKKRIFSCPLQSNQEWKTYMRHSKIKKLKQY
jgi:muramoyltetrapeptide carboxypeptidase